MISKIIDWLFKYILAPITLVVLIMLILIILELSVVLVALGGHMVYQVITHISQ